MYPSALPPGWHHRNLGDISDIRYGLGVPPEPSDNGVPMIRATNVKRGRIFRQGLLRIKASSVPKAKDAFLKPGEIIVVRSGAYTGDSAIITPEWAGAVAGYDLVVSANCDVESTFLAMWLLSEEFHVYFRGHRDRSAQPHLNRQQLGNAIVPVPPLGEQRQIARLLSAVQRAIERQERLIALTAELKKALMHRFFTEGTRGEPLKQTEIGPLPVSWDVVMLADAVSYIDYGISAPIPKTVPPNGVKIVSTADITKDGEILYEKIRRIIAPAKTVQRLTLKHGDVLFNWRNSSELIGKSAIFTEQDEPYVFASFILRIRCDETRSHNRFLCYLMNYFRAEGVFVKLSRRAVNQANYNRNEISVLKIPLPSIDEQREIADAITTVTNSHDIYVLRRDTLHSLFRTLLHQLMTAQVRIHDLDLSALDELAVEMAEVK